MGNRQWSLPLVILSFLFADCQLHIANFATMRIEKEIHQQIFRNSSQKALVNLLYTYGWVIEKIKTFLAQEDITHQQYNILRILRGAHPEPLSTLQIRERMLDKMSDTSRIVDRLIVKGLVQKSTCPRDKRLVDVVITEKGKELLKRLDTKNEEMDRMMGGLSEEEAETLSRLLDKLRNREGEDTDTPAIAE
jgi:MarR family transcriptional regulator, 2-MHQ and catechol-resistance regulon repressor